MKRQMLFVLVFVMMLLWVVPAGAGGWVSITLDALPGPATAGEPLTISFMVRQHGQTPTDWAEPEIHIRSLATGENAMFFAEPTSKLGQYSAQVIFPEEGEFEWYVSATPFLWLCAMSNSWHHNWALDMDSKTLVTVCHSNHCSLPVSIAVTEAI